MTIGDMSVGSLFSGIGGIDLGFEREGFETKWFVENNPYCQEVLKRQFPGRPIYGDIAKLDFRSVEPVSILTGGFPCQDISVAGRQAGIIEGKRSSLWKHYARAIGEIRPDYAVIENVPALAYNGLDIVLADLAEIGYDAEWFTLCASDFGAPHRRERIFIVAYPDDAGRHTEGKHPAEDWEQAQPQSQGGIGQGDAPDARSKRAWGKPIPPEGCGQDEERQLQKSDADWAEQSRSGEDAKAIALPTHARHPTEDAHVFRRKDNGRDTEALIVTDDWSQRVQGFRDETLQGKRGFSRFQDVREVEELFRRPDIPEPLVRRGGHGVSRRLDSYTQKERIQALGNAVIPQVAQFVARRLREAIEREAASAAMTLEK